MRKKSSLLLAAAFMASLMSGQQLINIASLPTGSDVVRSVPGSTTNLVRLGQLQNGAWADGWSQWSSLGKIIPSSLGVTPTDTSLYGLTVNGYGDRVFFGGRNFGGASRNRFDGVIAWGDDNYLWTSGNPDRLVFEFHDSNAGGTPSIHQAMAMMPNPSSNGVFIGIGTNSPTEQLHTTQGVRFQGLVNGAVTDFVGIDATGKLWRTPMTTGLGNLCINPQNPITGNYEIPLNNNNFYFSADNTNTNKTNFGFACGATPAGKLNVTTAFRTNTASNESYSIYSTNTYATGLNGVGVYGEANVPLNGNSREYGVWGKATGGRSTTGVFGQAFTSDATNGVGTGGFFEAVSTNQDNIGVNGTGWNATRQNVGVNGQGKNGQDSYGGRFNSIGGSQINIGVSGVATPGAALPAPSFASGISIGVYGQAPISSPSLDFAGYFDGDVRISGSGYIPTAWTPSDNRFKKEIKQLENVNDKLKKLHGYTYKFKLGESKAYHFSDKEQIGLIAQEIKEVFPQLVNTDRDGYLAVNYQGMVPVLLEAIKDQQTQIEQQNLNILSQQKQIDELKNIVKSLASNTNDINDKSLSIDLSDKNAIVLNQNVPNPFAESTVISYNIPGAFTKAQIIFTTNDGKVIKSVDVVKSGYGTLNVFANDLSNGLYNYSLVIDGKTIETKKMVKQ